ncbi:MAG: MFS transporter [Ignavibacteriaceae bacterium]|jgi:fucose permease
MKIKTFPIFLVFLAMGFGDAVGPLVGLAKDTFQISYTMAQLIPFAGYIMFGVLSIPMGIYQDKKGKKPVLILGLLIALIGLVLPILNGMYGKTVIFNPGEYFSFYVLLLSILLLCAGATILQVVGNPVMRDISPVGTYSKNLSLAQSIKAIGSSLGFLLPPFVAMAFGGDWSILFPVYAILVVITLFLVSSLKISEHKSQDSKPATVKSCLSLLSNGYVLLMVMAIFFYVGAEISMSSGVPILLKVNFGIKGFSLWVSWAIFFLPILIGRFGGSMILSRIPANKFFIATVIVAIIGIMLMFIPNEFLAFTGVVLVGLGFANIFPLVFSITIDRMPEHSNELSGLMVTAIVGGAIVPIIMGKVADLTNVLTGFVVPFVCLLYIAFTSYVSNKSTQAKA